MYLYFHIVYKKKKKLSRMCKSMDFMDSSSYTYMKWPLANYYIEYLEQCFPNLLEHTIYEEDI